MFRLPPPEQLNRVVTEESALLGPNETTPHLLPDSIGSVKKARPFLISGVTSAIVMIVISFFISDPTQAKSTAIVGVIVGITLCTIPLYNIDTWSLLKRSLLHFAIMLVTVLPLLLWSGWFSPVIAVVVFLLFGLAGWTIGYLVHRIQARKTTA